jgi:hypothetical protein
MKYFRPQTSLILIAFALLTLTASSPVWAQRSRAYGARGGFYVGGFAAHNAVGGGFDGESILLDISKGLTATVPDIETFFGLGGSVGIRTLQGGFEVNYQRYQHDVTWLNLSSKATVEYINVALKRYWLSRERIQPALHLGWIPYSHVSVNDGMLTTRGTTDARYRGSSFGFNGGLGLLIHLGDRLSAEGLVLYRYMEYEKVHSANGAGTIELGEPVSGNGFNGIVGLSLVLF